MKRELLRVISAAQAKEHELVSEAGNDLSNSNGRWSSKDHLAHLSWWREHNVVATINAIRTGGDVPPRLEDESQNAEIYAATKDLAASQIKDDAKRTWNVFEDAILACTEHDLVKPHPKAPGFFLWEIVPAHAGHIGTHLMWWHLENGRRENAEAAAIWSYEVESEAFPEPAKRADASYNLACFYSRAGQADKAVELLRGALAAKPELKQLAATDPDLEPIREDPRVVEVLA